jgi:hypothetical protein
MGKLIELNTKQKESHKTSGFIDFATSENCYAPLWSFGEICVGCGCCDRNKNKLDMYKSRLKYHRTQLDHNANFQHFSIIPNIRKMQEKNIKRSIEFDQKEIEKLKQIIKSLRS